MPDGAEVEEHDLALAQRLLRAGPARVEPPLAPGEDVRRERGAARAADAQLVLDGLDEIRHRRAGDDVRLDRRHRLAGDHAGVGHQLQLGLGLDAPELVHERRAFGEPRLRHDVKQLDGGLRPGALPERDPGRRAELPDRFRERGPAVAVVLDDDRSRRRLPVEVEPDEHPRQHVDRLVAGRDEGAGDPAVRVGDVPEGRKVALDPGQVLEVGARRDEERVEAATGEQLAELLAPSRVLVLVDAYPASTQYAAEPRAGHSRSGSAR